MARMKNIPQNHSDEELISPQQIASNKKKEERLVEARQKAMEYIATLPTDESTEASSIDFKCLNLPLDDTGMAMRVKLRNENKLRYWSGNIYQYEETHWKKLECDPLDTLLETINKILIREVPLEEDEKRQTKLYSFAMSYRNAKNAKNAWHLMKSLMVYNKEQFETRDDVLVNFLNGTLNVNTGQLQPHKPEDNFLGVLPFKYDSTIQPVNFIKFLDDVLGGDQELISYIKILGGITAIGNNSIDEEVQVWCYGDGSNGKNTFLQAIEKAFGYMSTQINPKLFLRRKSDSHTSEGAALRGKRLALTYDIDSGERLNDGIMKQYTSTGNFESRELYHEQKTLPITWHFWMSCNMLPNVSDPTHGTWRRLKVIPFNKKITAKDADKTIKKLLESEAGAIWTWLLEGAQEYLKLGRLPDDPKVVAEALAEWKSTEDKTQSFLNQVCKIGYDDTHKPYISTLKEIYDCYIEWCKEDHVMPLGKPNFSRALQQKGFVKDESNHHIGTRFIGIKSVSKWEKLLENSECEEHDNVHL